MKSAYQYWMPLLALYSGARLNELAQLRLKDIQYIKGVLSMSALD